MQKAVLWVEWGNERDKKKAVKIISAYEGIQSVAIDAGNKKVTVTGDVDPVQIVQDLRKRFGAGIEYVGTKETPTSQVPRTEEPDNGDNVGSSYNYYSAVGYPYYAPYPSPYYYPPNH